MITLFFFGGSCHFYVFIFYDYKYVIVFYCYLRSFLLSSLFYCILTESVTHNQNPIVLDETNQLKIKTWFSYKLLVLKYAHSVQLMVDLPLIKGPNHVAGLKTSTRWKPVGEHDHVSCAKTFFLGQNHVYHIKTTCPGWKQIVLDQNDSYRFNTSCPEPKQYDL